MTGSLFCLGPPSDVGSPGKAGPVDIERLGKVAVDAAEVGARELVHRFVADNQRRMPHLERPAPDQSGGFCRYLSK